MRESALVIYADQLISVSKGQPSSVEFNFDEVWTHRKKLGRSFNPGLLMWVHVHPKGFGTQYSSVDVMCAAGLHAAFGMLEHFGIACFDDSSFKNIHGRITWYRFSNGRFETVGDNELEHDSILIEEEAYMLKALSYGELWTPKISEFTDSGQSVQTSLSS